MATKKKYCEGCGDFQDFEIVEDIKLLNDEQGHIVGTTNPMMLLECPDCGYQKKVPDYSGW